ncbi:flagellar basal body-associated FliL family protein [Hydrogenophaga aquatica]
MAAKPPAGAENAKPKSKKLLIIIIGVLVLALAGAGAAFFLLKGHPEDEEDGAEVQKPVKSSKVKAPPQFMPLENLVVNLADEGGIRYAQVGVTLQVADQVTVDRIKAFMPSVRSGVLMLVSSRKAEELLRHEGKEKLASDILQLVRETTGTAVTRGESPVEAVLFSSLIVQ